MARYITVSTIGHHYHQPNLENGMEAAVEDMILYLQNQINQVLPDQPDIIVLPETCDMPGNCSAEQQTEFYRIRGNKVLDALADIAQEAHCYIAYPSFREAADGTWRNSIQLIDRSGNVAGTYNKNHPVVQQEIVNRRILAGKEAPLIECDFGTVACVICFDLNFDQLRQTYAKAKPDLILFSSQYHGGLMQAYWAYSCRAHFVSSLGFRKPCSILSPVGELIASSTDYYAYASARINLDCAVIHLDKHMDKLRTMRRKYGTKVKVTDPGCLGAVIISSETKEFTVHDLIREFEFQLLDDYFAESLAGQTAVGNVEP